MAKRISESASADELYAAYIAQISGSDPTVEVEPGIIRITFRDSEPDTEGNQRHVYVCITRDQLQAAAWTEFDIFDDTNPDVVPRTNTPVATGLDTFAFFTEEMLATLRTDESFVIYHRGEMHRSTKREPPPVRGHGDTD